MKTITIIMAILLIAWIAFIIFLRAFASFIRRAAIKKLRGILSDERILRFTDNAFFLGAEGQGPDIRNKVHGVLALTDRAVIFLPWYSQQPMVLPRTWMKTATTAETFLSQTVPGHILVVRADIAGRGEGRLGWLVKDAGEWAAELARKIET